MTLLKVLGSWNCKRALRAYSIAAFAPCWLSTGFFAGFFCLSLLSLASFGSLAAQTLRGKDLLILKTGEHLKGNFVRSEAASVVFKASSGKKRAYPRSKIRGIVLGEKELDLWSAGLWPGVPQFRRGQDLKGILIISAALLSMATIAQGTASVADAERRAAENTRPSQEDVRQQKARHDAAQGIINLGVYALALVYTWHILDWLWLGDHYRALLGSSNHRAALGQGLSDKTQAWGFSFSAYSTAREQSYGIFTSLRY